MKKNCLSKLFCMFFVLVFLGSSYGIVSRAINLKESENEISELRNLVKEPSTVKTNTAVNNVEVDSTEKIYNKKYDSLKKENQDFVCWLNVPGTNIDYPVVQGNDNNKYLNTSFLGKQTLNGSIFLDYRCNFKDSSNIVVYGHNMKNGTMFNSLGNYKNKSFFNKNKIINIETTDAIYVYEIFSTYVTSPNFNYVKSDFTDKEEYSLFLEKIKSMSQIKSDINLDTNDKIITLSTCSNEVNDGRRVVHAKLIEIKK